MLFYFFLRFTFTSDGLIVMTVAASISGDIVYSISNLKWMDGCPMRCFGGGVGGRGVFLLHGPCSFMWGIALTHSVLFYMEGFSYISGAFFFFMQEVCFPCPVLFHIRNLSYTPYASLCAEIF